MFQKIALTLLGLAVAGAWGFLSSRASDEDVKKNEQTIKEHAEKAEGRLRSVEDNVLVMCEFLDRQDKANDGPGLDCRKPR